MRFPYPARVESDKSLYTLYQQITLVSKFENLSFLEKEVQ